MTCVTYQDDFINVPGWKREVGVQCPFYNVFFWGVGEEIAKLRVPVFVKLEHFLFVAITGP